MALKRSGAKPQATLQDHRRTLEQVRADLPGMVVVAGECEFLRAEATAVIRDAWLDKYPNGDTVIIRGAGDGRPATLADIAAEFSGGSLFAREKLIVVRQAEKILFPTSRAGADDAPEASQKPAGDREKSFLERLDNPPSLIWLVLETAQLPKNRTLGKRLAEKCTVIPCPLPFPRDVPAWLSDRARSLGKSLTEEAADLLVRAHGQDLGVLAGEIDKLSLYAGEGKRIDAAMASEFLTGTIEFDVFGFTNAVEARQLEQAVFYARRITEQGTRDQRGKKEDGARSAHRVLAMLAGTVQGLLRARVAAARRLQPAEFAAAEKLSPWRAEKLLAASTRFSLRELRIMARFAADQIRRSHDTGGDPLLALELMAVKFTVGEKTTGI